MGCDGAAELDFIVSLKDLSMRGFLRFGVRLKRICGPANDVKLHTRALARPRHWSRDPRRPSRSGGFVQRSTSFQGVHDQLLVQTSALRLLFQRSAGNVVVVVVVGGG